MQAAAAAALLGAAAGPANVAADAFDEDWCGIDAGGFQLITDAPRKDAETMVDLLQLFRPVAERYLPGTANAADPPLTILVFSRVRDFRRAIGSSALVGFMQPSLTDNLMVVGPDPHADGEHESLLHEYVHYLLRTREDINIPGWFDEGMASLLSTARVSDDGMVIGELPRQRVERSIREARLSLADVLEAEDVWDWPAPRIRGFYDYSRVLVHRLVLGHEAGRPDWRTALADHLSGAEPSLAAALGVSTAQLGRRLDRYLARAGTVTAPMPEEQAMPAEFRCLSDAERTRRLSVAILQQNPKLAVRQLRRALGGNPDDPSLWIAMSQAQESNDAPEDALAAARHALSLAPGDPAAAVRLAGALAVGCILEVSDECRARWQEAVPLLRTSLDRDPTHQEAIFILGLAYLYSGRPGDALNYLRIVHRRQPWAPPVNFYLGETYRLIGDSRAEAHLERARRWSPNELWRRLAEAGLERLAATSGARTPG